MRKLSQIFKEIKGIDPPKELEFSILKRIEMERERKVKNKLFFSYAGLYGSVFATSYALFAFGNAFLKSEFWNMFSLIFSDLMIVAGNWKTYGYSLLETFPVMSLVAILIPILALFFSFNFYFSIKYKIKSFHHHTGFKFAS